MSTMLLSLMSVITRQAKRRFLNKIRQPTETQAKFLQTLLQHHKNTVFGQEYRLGEIKTVDQFRERIPVLPYSDYEPYVERIAQGEPNILTPEPVIYLNLTSGTTGKQKQYRLCH
jgi:acyl-CoA synthetase (AMP-forming)/AMP-acid ligase II